MSHGLNPVQRLWSVLKLKLEQQIPSSKEQLRRITCVEWEGHLSTDLCTHPRPGGLNCHQSAHTKCQQRREKNDISPLRNNIKWTGNVVTRHFSFIFTFVTQSLQITCRSMTVKKENAPFDRYLSVFLSPYFSLIHVTVSSSLSQALFLSLFWQVLAGWSGDWGQINTQSNSCELASSVCVWGREDVCLPVWVFHLLPSFLLLLIILFLNGPVDDKPINIYRGRDMRRTI